MKIPRLQTSRPGRLIAAFVLGLVVGASGVYNLTHYREPISALPTEAVAKIDASLPVRINIPAVSVEAEFEEPLGVNEAQEIEIPKNFDTVAWYQHSPTPGELGPSVILGHMDSYAGPEIFYPLRWLKAGDTIEIVREDGSTATFTVTELKWHRQSGFPTEAVYGDIDHAGLRLITCSGDYDHVERRYSHNLIVYATLTDFQ